MSVTQTNSSSPKEAPENTSIHESQQPGAGQTTKTLEHIDEPLLAGALLTHPSVDDCAVRRKATQTSEQEFVAYVVLAGQFSPERLQSYLPTVLPQVILPKVNFVPVAQLPLTTEGQIDEQTLTKLPLIDSDLIQQWEEQILSLPEIEQAAVVVQEIADNIPPLHLSDLLPDWKTASRISSQAKVTPQDLPTDSETQSESQSFSISEGEPLREEADAPKNLSQALRRTVKRSPDKGITYIQKDGSNTVQLYPALLEKAERILTGLRALGLKPQDKIIFQFDSNEDYIPAFWGCILGGFVPVPVATAPVYEPSNSVVKKLYNTWQTLEQPIVFTNGSLAPKLRALSSQLNLENFQIETVEDFLSCDREQNWYDSQPDDLAVLLFTSGSTGVPKGVMLTHGNIISNVAASSQINSFSREDTSLNWLHLDHVGSLVRCSIRDIYVGSQQIHAPSSLVLENPLKLLDWIDEYRVTFAWAPNFALGLINDRAEIIQQRHWDLSCLRSVLSVAEAIVPKTAKKFTQLLTPHGFSAELMHSAWGMSETCAAVTFSHRYLLALPSDDYPYVEVGGPTPGFQMRIVDNKNQLVPEDTVGRLQIKGPMITVGYYQNPQLNQDTFTEDGWFKTGDLGLFRQGRLTITGREKDLIIINGLNHYSYEIEAVVEEVEGVEVSYTAACALRQPGNDTDQLLVFFHTPFAEDERLIEILKEIRSNIVREVGISPTYLIPVTKETIPKTSIGKIQRLQLRKQFEAGEFDATAKRVDILLGNENTLPDWFYRNIWRCKEALSLESQPRTGLSLVFLDSLGLGELLCTELGKHNQPCIGVEVGSTFAKLADNRYSINPNHPDDYRQLLLSVAEENLSIAQILHLWNYQEYAGEVSSLEALEEAQEKGVYSLLFLVQALAQIQNSETPIRLQIIASHSQPTSPEDEVACERTPILGLVKTIPQEMPWLDCRHLDLSLGELDVNAAQVIRELQVIPREQEVAYRNGQRLVSRLEKVDFCQQQKQEMPFKPGGMYLLSGGLGEIGVEIAKYLLQQYGARLLLVGRTPLPSRDTWETYLNQEDGLSRRIKAYQELEELGEVHYEVADIGNLAQLKQAVENSSNHWQSQLDGVIHLARVTQEHLLTEETRESLAAMLSPKVSGAWALHQLIKNQPNAVFVNFSSVSSVFGTYRMGGYAAANRFLDCFSHYQRYKQSLRSYCFAWSIWEEVGADRSYQMRDLSQARGYYTIPSKQGLSSFFGGLNHDQGYVIVGLDGSNSYMRRYTEIQSPQSQQLSAYFTSRSDQVSTSVLQELKVSDRFGQPSTCDFQQLEEMPLTEAGEVDRDQLSSTGTQASAEKVAPSTEIERKLVDIWQQALGISPIGIRDNFFELGGSSILAVSLFGTIEKEFGKRFPLTILFEAPTIEQLAQTLEPSEQVQTWKSLVLLKPGNSKAPLFFVHDVDGTAILYMNLARRLSPERPVYGLRPHSTEGCSILHTRISDMASYYIEEMRSVQPKGPYLVGGLCAGGVIAFEIACQLQAQGEKVPLVAIIDAIDVKGPSRSGYSNSKRMSRFSQALTQGQQLKGQEWLTYVLSTVTKKVKNLISYEVSKKIQDTQETFKVTLYRYYLDKKLPLAQFLQDIPVRTIYNKLAKTEYVPPVYQGKLTLWRATENVGMDDPLIDDTPAVEIISDPLLGWGKRSTNGVETFDIPGGHSSMLQEPHVEVLAEKLEAFIKEVQADN